LYHGDTKKTGVNHGILNVKGFYPVLALFTIVKPDESAILMN
jgi:hypothetical protein